MTHLSLIERETIETLLKGKKNFTQIAKEVKQHRTTISKEILNHRIHEQPNTFGRNFVMCELESSCENYHGIACTKKCSKFKPKTCPSTLKPPYVCNACKKKSGCSLQKFYYRAKTAQQESKEFFQKLDMVFKFQKKKRKKLVK